jgi:hypothetical protein
MDPKSKPRKGQTQEENETEFEQALELKGLDMDSPEDLGVTITHGYEGTPLTFDPTSGGGTYNTSTHHAPTFMDFDESVVVTFRQGETEHKALRDRYPALEKAYDHYCTLLALAQNGPEDLDN